MSDLNPADIDLVRSVFEHRLRQSDLDRILAALSSSDRDELLAKMGDLLRHVSALVDVSNKVNDSLSLDVMLPRLIEVVSDALNADRSTLFLYDAETGELFSRVAQGSEAGQGGEEIGEIRFCASLGIAGSVFGTGRGEIIPDAYADPRFNREVDRRTGYRTRSIVCAPIRYKGETIGVVQALNKSDGEFDQEDMRLLEVLTSQAASALANARLHERVQQARREQSQLLEVTSAIASELKLESLLGKIISATTEMLEADRSSLFMYDPQTDELWSRIAEGIGTREIRIPCDAGIAGSCFVLGEIVNIADAYEDPRFNPEVDRKTGYRTRSVLCMPIVNKEGRKLGVIQVLNRRGGPFRRFDERRLRAFTAQAAIALENAQLFDEVLNERNYNESILKSLTNGVITLDARCNVIKANDAVVRILEWRRDEVLGRPLGTAFALPANQWVLEALDRVAATGQAELAMDAELELPRKRSISVNLNVVPLIDVSERAIGYMLVLEDITAEKRVKGTMARYMTKEVADRLLEGGDEVLGGQAQEATVLFSDIRGFTTLAEELGPRKTVSMLNEYFTDMIEVIFSHRGILDKYIGDALMALFGAPFPSEDDADNALFVANEMVRVLRRFNEKRRREGNVALDIGIGISTGELVAGNIGSPKRMHYTVIGDAVNLASHLEAATRVYGVKVLYSEHTADALRMDVPSREVDLIRVRGRSEPVVVYESLAHHDQSSFPNMERTLEAYRRGMKSYCNADWRSAACAFAEALEHNPRDALSRVYLGRCRHYEAVPPPPDWDGVWTMHGE